MENNARWAFLDVEIANMKLSMDVLAEEMMNGDILFENLRHDYGSFKDEFIQDVLGYIQDNGLMVSDRWRIGEESCSNGTLVIRDVNSSNQIIMNVTQGLNQHTY